MKISRHRNHWFGFGARYHYCKDDFVYVVLRFAWWQWWLEWDL